MGLIRKAASVSTLGAVKYTSRREAQTKAAIEEARLAREQRRELHDERDRAGRAERDEQLAEAERDAEGKPWYRQPTLGAALRSRKQG